MTQADMMKEAIVRLHYEYFYPENIEAHLLLQVHDELVIEFDASKYTELPERVKSIITDTANRYLTGVTMDADYHVDKTWIK